MENPTIAVYLTRIKFYMRIIQEHRAMTVIHPLALKFLRKCINYCNMTANLLEKNGIGTGNSDHTSPNYCYFIHGISSWIRNFAQQFFSKTWRRSE